MRTLMLLAISIIVCATHPCPVTEAGTGDEKAPQSARRPQSDPLSEVRALAGHWQGKGEGQSGVSTVYRVYEFVLEGRYLHVRNGSTYAPQDKNPKGERHEDWGMYSFDRGRQKVVFRQFHSEGFVNQYVLDRVSDDGREIVFVSESIENIPAGFRARETYRLTGRDGLEETFEIAEPGGDFVVYTVNTLKRGR